MKIKKIVIVIISISVLLLVFLLMFSIYTYKKVESIKRERYICDEASLLLTSIDRSFWKLRNTFTESDKFDFNLYKKVLKDLDTLKNVIILLDLSSSREKINEIDILLSFLNQFRISAEKLRKEKEDLNFAQTSIDTAHFSLISTSYIDQNPALLYNLLLLNRAYLSYKLNRRKEELNVLKYIIDKLGNISPFKDYMNKLSEFKFLILYEKEVCKNINRTNFQLKYINERFKDIFSHLNLELEDFISLKHKELFFLRAKVLNIYFWVAFFLLLGFIMYISWVLLKKVLHPIHLLNKVVTRVSKGDMDARFISRSDDEISRFGMAFNEMLDKIENVNKRLEKEMQKAKRLSKAKSEFLKRISHEFRTPLNGIMGFSEVLLDEEISESQRRYVEIILRESKKLRDLIDEILTFSEIEEDKFSPIVSEIDLVEKLREIINIKTEEASAKGLKIIFLNKVGTNDIVIGDSLSLVKIFEQLISNAIKFTEKGKIEVAIAEKKEEEDSILYYFYIKDTGIGIEKDQIDKIFEPFYQLDPILTRRFGGLGLGLTLVKRLIEYMGGHIWIDSTPGQGTTYNFTLKFKKPS